MAQLDTLDQVAQHVIAWHQDKLNLVNHMLNIPTGTTVTIEEVDYTLEGDFLKGYEAAMLFIKDTLANDPPLVEVENEI
jgi:hypothetical protein